MISIYVAQRDQISMISNAATYVPISPIRAPPPFPNSPARVIVDPDVQAKDISP